VRASAVILAAGRGHRIGSGENKAFLPIADRPLLVWTLLAFADVPEVSEIVLVVAPGEKERVRRLLQTGLPPATLVGGGDVRRDSALAGVDAASGEIVLIHDGARPFASVELIGRVLAGAIEVGACVPVLPIVDTLREIAPGDSLTAAVLDRERIVRVQTPQGFRRSLIRRALQTAEPDVPDDAGAVLALGEAVRPVPGEETNLKVTVPGDLPLAEAIAEIRRPDRT